MNLFTLSLIFFLHGGVIKEDFCVHPDSPARCGKEGAWVDALPQGWAVTWSDYRNPGVWGAIDVYAQLLDIDAEPVDSNFRVNVSSGDILEAAGTVGADGQGNILVTWGASLVRFRRRFTPDGEPQGEIVEGGMSGVHLAMNQSGDYVTVGTKSYLQINLQAFSKNDICKWGPVEVAVAERFSPTARAAIAPDGSSVVVWDDVIDGVSCIFGRCFDKDGLPRGEAFEVTLTEGALDPVAAMDAEGDFVVAWVQPEADGGAVYFRRYEADGSPKAGPVRAHDPLGDANVHYRLGIAAADDGDFAVMWSDDRTGKYRVYLQNFSDAGLRQGQELALSTEDDCLTGHLALRGEEWCGVYVSESGRVFARTGFIQGALAEEHVVSDDESSVWEVFPQVFADDDGDFLVTWKEARYPDPPVYARWFDSGGEPLTDPINLERYGRGAMNRSTGDFAVIWKEGFGDESLVLVQRYSSGGQPNGDPVQVDPSNRELGGWFDCDVSMNRSGEFTALWLMDAGEENQIVARRFDAAGNPIDADIIVVGAEDAIPRGGVAVEMADDGSFIAAWEDARLDLHADIFGRRFDAQGRPEGSDFKVSDDPSSGIHGNYQRHPCIAADTAGSFCIAWAEDSRITDPEPAFLAYAQFYDAAGEELGRNVGTELTHAYFLDMGIAAAPGGGYVLFGTDYSAEDGDPEVCACYYDEQGNQTGNKIQINQPDLFPYNHQAAEYNCVAATDDQIVYVWLDNRRHKGWDVYAKITDWNVPAVEEAAPDVSHVKLTPFLNRLSYEVPEEAILTVYNSAGRRVAEQVVCGKGEWKPAGISSGVYFARVESVEGRARAKVVIVR